MGHWPFDDPENVATVSVRQIVEGGEEILLVRHDADDGMWQFLTGNQVTTVDARTVSLASIYQLDPSIGELADLPLGWQASREATGQPWKRRQRDPTLS